MLLSLACCVASLVCVSGCEVRPKTSGDEAVSPPVASVLDSVLDYGTVGAGLTVEKTVVVRNTGGQELWVGVEPLSCDCLSVNPMELRVASGEAGRLRVAFSASGAEGDELKFVRLATNGVRKRIDVWVLAHVESDVQFELHQ